jgi:hypothetical protein
MAGELANHIGQSMVKSCDTEADIEGAYRLLRNEQVSCEEIAEGGFRATAAVAEQAGTLLALEDSTALKFGHGVCEELGHIGRNKDSKSKGFMVHSVLLVDAESGHSVGLIEQSRWVRGSAEHGKSKERKLRAYEDKESIKWERASAAMSRRLGGVMSRTISVCDRESDVYEYLRYKLSHQQRFVIRAARDRCIAGSDSTHLFEFKDQLKGIGQYRIAIPQKGGRKARTAVMEISYAPVTLCPPKHRQAGCEPLSLNVVICREVSGPGEDRLEWILLTAEAVTSAAQARQIVQYYEMRWKIEEYHKAWKSGGTQVEKQRMQTADNLERMAVILAFVAVRLLQLRELALDQEKAKQTPCTQLLQDLEWRVLWLKQGRRKLPSSAPSMHWAYYALAKLGGWYDSKRTGKVGWSALWDGWFKLEQMVEGAKLSALLAQT